MDEVDARKKKDKLYNKINKFNYTGNQTWVIQFRYMVQEQFLTVKDYISIFATNIYGIKQSIKWKEHQKSVQKISPAMFYAPRLY